mgnify:CR=1 FL=1
MNEYYLKHRERILKRAKERYREMTDDEREYARMYYRAYYQANREHICEQHRRYMRNYNLKKRKAN